MKNIYVILAFFSLTANAQTTYFEQNFSAGGTPANYVSSTPDNEQFNGLAGLNATITNNAVQFDRLTGSGTGHISRSTNSAGSPTSLHVQFSFEVILHNPSVSGTNAVIFYVGSGFMNSPANPNNGDTYARLGIALAPAPASSGQFQVRTIPSGGGGTTSSTYSGRHTITFAMNNSGATLTYLSPTGSVETIPNDTYDIWVGTTKFANDQSVLTPGQAINNFKFRLNDGAGVMQIDDILMRDISGALPVTLFSFTAKPEGDRVQLAWATTMERDADRFLVERSPDLGEYVPVGEVKAKGTTDERQYYGLTDLNPQSGTNYYRLKQIDLDGTVHAYKPVSAIVRPNEPVVSVFPNPANVSRIHLRLWQADEATIRLLDATGQAVRIRLERQPGEADLFVDQPLTPGIYWVEVQTNGQKKVVKVLVP